MTGQNAPGALPFEGASHVRASRGVANAVCLTAAIAAVLVAVVGVGPLHAQPGLTLKEAIALSQRQGLLARGAQDARESARARNHGFFAGYLPQFSIFGTTPNYRRSISPVIQPDGTTLYRPLQETDAGLTGSVQQNIPWTNTTVQLQSGLSQVNVAGDQGFRTWSSTPFSFIITQPVLRANSQAWDIKEQGLRFESSERKYIEAREDVAIGTTNAFFDLYAARVTLANAEKNAAVNDTLYTLNKGRLEVGKIGENDLLQSELALLRARSAFDDAKLAYERVLSTFRIAVNVPPGTPLDIIVNSDVPAFEADPSLAMEQARLHASTFTDAEASEVHADRSVSEARWNTGAGGTLSASYGYNATAATAPAAYKNLLDAQRLQFQVQVPIWLWGVHSAAVEAAKADRSSARSAAQLTRVQMSENARFAALQLTQARRTLTISAKADTVAAKRFEVAYNRYVIGKIAIDNLYIAQNEKDQALQSYVQALRGYWSAYYVLRRLTLYDFEASQPIR